jgi:hypothetical protein
VGRWRENHYDPSRDYNSREANPSWFSRDGGEKSLGWFDETRELFGDFFDIIGTIGGLVLDPFIDAYDWVTDILLDDWSFVLDVVLRTFGEGFTDLFSKIPIIGFFAGRGNSNDTNANKSSDDGSRSLLKFVFTGKTKYLFDRSQPTQKRNVFLSYLTGDDYFMAGDRRSWMMYYLTSKKKYRPETAEFSLPGFLVTGRFKYLFSRSLPRARRNMLLAYLTGDDYFMAGRMHNWFYYRLTGNKKYMPHSLSRDIWGFVSTFNPIYLFNRTDPARKRHLFLYMLSRDKWFLAKHKPSLAMFYLTRDRNYLGNGAIGLKPRFWPDVFSEGFFLAFGMFGSGRKKKRDGKRRSTSAARKARNKQVKSRQQRVKNDRAIRVGAKKTRAKQRNVTAQKRIKQGVLDYHQNADVQATPQSGSLKKYRKGAVDYHLTGDVSIKKEDMGFTENPFLYQGTFGKYRYKVSFREDGELEGAYLYGKTRMLAGWMTGDADEWQAVGNTHLNLDYQAVMRRIVSQIREKGGGLG